MDLRTLLEEILGRKLKIIDENVNQILYENITHNRKSLTFNEVYANLLANAPVGSYLEWIRHHSNDEVKNFRRRLQYRYNKFKSVREIMLYLHTNNYLAGKFGSPTPNIIEQYLQNDSLWYMPRVYTPEELELLNKFI